MAKIITVFNNKGGVGKSTICWNLGDSLGRLGKKVLMVDFDPQCNLSIAMLGHEEFINALPNQNVPYGTTIRSFLQRFLQNTGGEQIFLHKGKHTHQNVHLIAGDFWLNVYADSLNVGGDLLSGTGLSRYVALRKIVELASEKSKISFDYVLIDLPPSFSSLVRAAFYSSDYFIVPCTSDNFSAYCVGLIGQMIPNFIKDWQSGISRFKESNPYFSEFDLNGRPAFAGWVFNGFDTARKRRTDEERSQNAPRKDKQMVQADRTLHDRLTQGIETDLVGELRRQITHYDPIAIKPDATDGFRIGDIEDANVLIQNSIWLSVPLGYLETHSQVTSLQARSGWATNQVEQIELLRGKFQEMAERVIKNCI